MSTAENWSPQHSRRFVFAARHFNPETGRIVLDYQLDELHLQEQFLLPAWRIPPMCDRALDRALDLLHWVAGISYWKAGCPQQLEFAGRQPEAWQADWLTRLYHEGLAEFAWRNGLDRQAWPVFPHAEAASVPTSCCELPRRSLVPMGGGKDSLVALERLRYRGESPVTVQVGSAELIRRVAHVAGTQHLLIERRLDPQLAELNRTGAWNGHVPITAINAAVLIVLALVVGFDRIVFANERSADEATLHDAQGRPVNHQFSKSLAFETMLRDWIARYITPDLQLFSLLRRDRELAICREFAGLTRYHEVFSSCNRNFHLDGARTRRWCGQCPKCHFVFLALAPFMAPAELEAIFGANLLDQSEQQTGFQALLALDGIKPFECVGEANEARSALAALATDPRWQNFAVVSKLAPLLDGLAIPDLAWLCQPGGAHHLPAELISKGS